MNRKDREVKAFNEITDILDRCDTLRLGLDGGSVPYVVPVSFGWEEVDGKVVIFFHGAIKGLKADCLAFNNNVCIEADIFYKAECVKDGITARYESVIGKGVVSKTDGSEKIHGLTRIAEHYGFIDYPIGSCKGLGSTNVYKIVLSEITGKRNLPIAD